MSLVSKSVISPTNFSCSAEDTARRSNEVGVWPVSMLQCPSGVKEKFELITTTGDEV